MGTFFPVSSEANLHQTNRSSKPLWQELKFHTPDGHILAVLLTNRCYCLSINSRFAWIDSYICRQYGFSYRPQFIWSLICLQTGLSYYCLISLPTFASLLQYPSLVLFITSLVSCLSRQTILTTVLFHSPPLAGSSNTLVFLLLL